MTAWPSRKLEEQFRLASSLQDRDDAIYRGKLLNQWKILILIFGILLSLAAAVSTILVFRYGLAKVFQWEVSLLHAALIWVLIQFTLKGQPSEENLNKVQPRVLWFDAFLNGAKLSVVHLTISVALFFVLWAVPI